MKNFFFFFFFLNFDLLKRDLSKIFFCVVGDSTVGLNLLTARVLESIEKYGLISGTVDNNTENCSSTGCRFKRLIGTNDTWNDYVQLFNSYAAEEETHQYNDNLLETKT